MSDLPLVRRFEAAGFRAWPAASVQYDGTWVLRLTAGHPAKRLNSVNPLDPDDLNGLNERIGRASRRFEAHGRPLTFRLTPLAGDRLQAYFNEQGWNVFDESIVMRLCLAGAAMVDGAIDQIPLKDISRFVDAAMKVRRFDQAERPGLSEVISAICAEVGLFVLEHEGEPVSSLICVQDGELAGLFEMSTALDLRGRGYARRTMLSALKWAKLRGVRQAWLQVGADNESALGLYRSLGFEEIYRYHYRQPAGT